MAHRVLCRICRQQFDTDQTTDWVMPSTNYYYHKRCYEDFAKKKKTMVTNPEAQANDDMWFSVAYDYLTRDLKVQVDFPKLKRQWDKYLREGRTAKGIFFSLKYFYDIKRNDPHRSQSGIGIIPHIYDEACEYWCKRAEKDATIIQKIEHQVRLAAERKIIIVQKRKETTPKKKIISLTEIEELEGAEDER